MEFGIQFYDLNTIHLISEYWNTYVHNKQTEYLNQTAISQMKSIFCNSIFKSGST